MRFSDDFLLQNGMHHRYGRYGPDAWLRLRKRRMSRFTRMLVRSEYSAVIRARFRLDEGERIFIVEITPLDGENAPGLSHTISFMKISIDMRSHLQMSNSLSLPETWGEKNSEIFQASLRKAKPSQN